MSQTSYKLFFEILLAFENQKMRADSCGENAGEQGTEKVFCRGLFKEEDQMFDHGLAPENSPCFHR